MLSAHTRLCDRLSSPISLRAAMATCGARSAISRDVSNTEHTEIHKMGASRRRVNIFGLASPSARPCLSRGELRPDKEAKPGPLHGRTTWHRCLVLLAQLKRSVPLFIFYSVTRKREETACCCGSWAVAHLARGKRCREQSASKPDIDREGDEEELTGNRKPDGRARGREMETLRARSLNL